MPNLANTQQVILRSIIFYIHVFTRTPFIIVFYGISAIALFGGASGLSSFCFLIFAITIFLNIFLVIAFNNNKLNTSFTKIAGEDFCDKYLSHSIAALKSLARSIVPTSIFFAYDHASQTQQNSAADQLLKAVKEQERLYHSWQSRPDAEQQAVMDTLQRYKRELETLPPRRGPFHDVVRNVFDHPRFQQEEQDRRESTNRVQRALRDIRA